MKSFFNKFKYMLLFIGIAAFLHFLIFSDIFITISFMIINPITSNEDTLLWILPYLPLSTVYFSLFGCLPWKYHRSRSDDGRREYLDTLGSDRFDRKREKQNRKKDKEFKKEIWAYTLAIIFTCAVMVFKDALVGLAMVFACPFTILVFYLFNRKFYVDLREAWADERIRLNPDKDNCNNSN